MCSWCGTLELVDETNRTVATLNLPAKDYDKAESSLRLAISRWDLFGVVGGYARDADGRLLAYA